MRNPLYAIFYFISVVIDNEKSLNSNSITFMMKDQQGILVYTAPPYKCSVNGQIERFHSTLSEIMICLKSDGIYNTFQETIDRAIYEYNFSIHSVTNKKPLKYFLGGTSQRIRTNIFFQIIS